MYEPSGVGRSEGEAVVYSAVMELVDVRYHMAVTMPPDGACMR